jgi:cation diffusion facilitator family transporter
MAANRSSIRNHIPHSATPRSAALTSMLAALSITLLKLITGVLTGSLGMLSEAAHSGIDLIASGITLLAVRASDRPADEEHNYGHGKLESLSAALEAALMIVSCLWIAHEALHRMRHHVHLALHWSIWPFVVLLLSIAVDATRARSLHRVALEHRSDALEADAVHFGTDIWSSAAVFLGLLATFLGERLAIPVLEYADPIAALVVAVVILSVTWRLARHTIDSLLDATPPEVRAQLRRDLVQNLNAIPGVLAVQRVRLRRSGPNYFVDLTLSLPRNLTFQRSEQLTFAATEAVQRLLPGADVVIHTVPTVSLDESVFDRIRAVAARSNLTLHDVSVQQLRDVSVQQLREVSVQPLREVSVQPLREIVHPSGQPQPNDGGRPLAHPGSHPGAHPGAHPGLHVEQHLEVPETMPLRQAHDIATQLESEMRREVPGITTLLTHIESEPTTISTSAQVDASQNLEDQLRATASHFPEILDIHEITLTRGHGGAANSIQVNCHVTLPDDLPMQSVHEIITNFESEFRLDHPQVSRVFIHPEPATDNRR